MSAYFSGPIVRSRTVDGFRPDELDAAVTGARLDHVQLEAGHFVGELVHAGLGDCRVDHGAYNLPLLCCGEMPADRITLAFVAAEAGLNLIQGTTVPGAAVAAFAEGSELLHRTAPETRWLTLQVHRDLLAQLGLGLGTKSILVRPLDAAAQRLLQRAVGAAVRTLYSIEVGDPEILDGAAAGRAAAESLTAAFGAVLPTGAQAIASRRWQTRCALVRRMRDLFVDHLSQPLLVTQLCAQIGASVGTLERACVESYGVGPKRLLTSLRLARARRLLLSAAPGDTTVSQVAGACGLFHVGRFSTSYAALYGESPSATLRSKPTAPRTRSRRTEVVSTQPVSQWRHL